jgi:hypothetical protein
VVGTQVADITKIMMFRDGGTIEFRVTGSDADGSYHLRTPFAGLPRPLFKAGAKLEFGSVEELAVLRVLREWLAKVVTDTVSAALAELDKMRKWRDLPPNLSQVIPIHRVRHLIRVLSERCT